MEGFVNALIAVAIIAAVVLIAYVILKFEDTGIGTGEHVENIYNYSTEIINKTIETVVDKTEAHVEAIEDGTAPGPLGLLVAGAKKQYTERKKTEIAAAIADLELKNEWVSQKYVSDAEYYNTNIKSTARQIELTNIIADTTQEKSVRFDANAEWIQLEADKLAEAYLSGNISFSENEALYSTAIYIYNQNIVMLHGLDENYFYTDQDHTFFETPAAIRSMNVPEGKKVGKGVARKKSNKQIGRKRQAGEW